MGGIGQEVNLEQSGADVIERLRIIRTSDHAKASPKFNPTDAGRMWACVQSSQGQIVSPRRIDFKRARAQVTNEAKQMLAR